MSSYYDDEDFADEYRRRDEEALDAAIEDKALRAEGGVPWPDSECWYCHVKKAPCDNPLCPNRKSGVE